MSSSFLELNPEQRQAVNETEGYVRVIAGAGSGKTRALTGRYIHLVKNLGISPSKILCVTFTNKAAGEMKQRIRKYLQDDDCGYICTFHGFCVKLLHEDIHVLNYPKQFQIADVEDQKAILKTCFEKLGITLSDRTIKDAIKQISRIKHINPALLAGTHYIELVTSPDERRLLEAFQNAQDETERIFASYLIEQRRNYSLDFNDLILFTLFILEKDEAVREKWQHRLQYIMVDEFQDINLTQYKLVTILSAFHENLFIVGDPDQTIYTWRGANPEFFINFDRDFPSTKTFLLEKNYRSNGSIVSAANALIRKNSMRIDKKLDPVLESKEKPSFCYCTDSTMQAGWTATQIAALIDQGVKPQDICILYRAHYLSREIEEQLIIRKVPYKIYNGIAFYERKEIKDVHAYLRFMLIRDDISFRRIINEPKRKFGKKSLQNLEAIAEEEHCSLYEALLQTTTQSLFVAPKTSVQSFIELTKKYEKLTDVLPVSEFMQGILHESGYEEMLQTQADQERLDNLAQLKQAIVKFENDAGEDVTLQDYVEHIALFTSGDETDTDAVKIMTIHNAKGLEFPYVFVYEMSEGVFPSAKANTQPAMEEERRLAYVAFTRAKQRLFLTCSAGYNPMTGFRRPSRFIFNSERANLDYVSELPEDVLDETTEYIINNEKMLDLIKNGYLPDGTRVCHQHFGVGTIICHDTSAMTYTIKFDGTKTERTVHARTELNIYNDDKKQRDDESGKLEELLKFDIVT